MRKTIELLCAFALGQLLQFVLRADVLFQARWDVVCAIAGGVIILAVLLGAVIAASSDKNSVDDMPVVFADEN